MILSPGDTVRLEITKNDTKFAQSLKIDDNKLFQKPEFALAAVYELVKLQIDGDMENWRDLIEVIRL
jgi:hypothetical protein